VGVHKEFALAEKLLSSCVEKVAFEVGLIGWIGLYLIGRPKGLPRQKTAIIYGPVGKNHCPRVVGLAWEEMGDWFVCG
jgi:hypothetical protein